MKMVANKLVDIIEKDIQKEEEAYTFYMALCAKVKDETVKDTLKFIAAEEKAHKAFLVNYRDTGYGNGTLQMREVAYYKIAEHQKEPEVSDDMQSGAVFLLAAHRELKAFHFYSELAAIYAEGKTQNILLKMANEELKHKEKMEYLYANTAFPQTAGG